MCPAFALMTEEELEALATEQIESYSETKTTTTTTTTTTTSSSLVDTYEVI